MFSLTRTPGSGSTVILAFMHSEASVLVVNVYYIYQLIKIYILGDRLQYRGEERCYSVEVRSVVTS